MTAILKTIQADVADSLGLEFLEIRSSEFPLLRRDILTIMNDPNRHVLKCTYAYQKVGWVVFGIEDQGDTIRIYNIATYDDALLDQVLAHMLDTLCISPKKPDRLTLKITWPEYGIDSSIFKFLLGAGFKSVGLSKDEFFAYNARYDGIKLEKSVEC